jgi:RNA polymerase sigma-70 factor (ECF subfamily)
MQREMSANDRSALDTGFPSLVASEEATASRLSKAQVGGGDLPARGGSEHDESDGRLMQRYRAGDHRAFELLYGRYRAPLRRFITRLCGNLDEAEEIFQEVWTAVIRARRAYRPTAKFSTYLFSIAHRRLQDRWRGL